MWENKAYTIVCFVGNISSKIIKIDLMYAIVIARKIVTFWNVVQTYTSSSAIAEGPRDALSQLKSSQLL